MSGEFPFRRFISLRGQELLPLNAKACDSLYGFLNKEKKEIPVFCCRSISADSRFDGGQIHTIVSEKFSAILLDIKTGKGTEVAQACLRSDRIINFRPSSIGDRGP